MTKFSSYRYTWPLAADSESRPQANGSRAEAPDPASPPDLTWHAARRPMMRRRWPHMFTRWVRLLAFGCLFGGSALPAAAQQLKIGFVNVPKVLDQAPQARSADQRLEKEFGPRDSKILAMKRDLVALNEKLSKNAAVMSNSERQRQEADMRQTRREIRRLEDEFREDVNLRRSQELGKLQRQVVEVIQGLAKAENFDLIISDGVIYAGSKVDITDQVIARLKQGG